MTTINTLIQRFQSLNTDDIINESFVATETDFEKSQQLQLLAGKTNTGDPISPLYKNDKYAEKKNEMNALPGYGIPDLYLTGSFSEQINAKLEGDSVFVFSNDVKSPILEGKYHEIFGLGTSFKSEYLDILGPVIKEKISMVTGLTFV